MAKQDIAAVVDALRSDQTDRALKLLRPLLKRYPRSAVLNDLAGLAQLKSGKLNEAVGHLEKATRQEPRNANFQLHLGEARRAGGDMAGAAEAYRAALETAPENGGAASGLAVALEAMGSPDAVSAYERALELQPQDVALMVRLAGLRAAIGEGRAAIALLRRVVAMKPGLAAAQNNLGVLLTEHGEAEEAAAALRQACALAPDRPDYQLNRAIALKAAGAYDGAREAYDRAIKLAPENAEAHAGVASLEERRNRLDDAREAAEKARALDPGQGEAALTLARLDRRAGDLDKAAESLAPLLAREDLPLDIATSAATELGVIRDRQDQPAAAIEAFARANALHDASPAALIIDRQAFPRMVEALRGFNAATSFADWPVEAADHRQDPVFLVGFPRSGTTLTEQILAAHPALTTTDEEPILTETIGEIATIAPSAGEYPASLAELDAGAAAKLRAIYFEKAAPFLDPAPGTRLVDKLPLNLIHLPSIRRLFPQAHVILALRDPRDVVFSNWMQNFDLNPAMIQFLKLETAAETYASVMSLWLAMRDRLGLKVIEHRYEDLVADPEAAARRLIAFLELPWEDGVLDFSAKARRRVISTPSARDVASGGVFTRARGRWTRYVDHLTPIFPVLAPYVEAFGYAETPESDTKDG